MTQDIRIEGVISSNELAVLIETQHSTSASPLLIYDASVAFTTDEQGQPKAEPARGSYLDHHIPGALFVDHQADLSDASSDLRYTLLDPARLQAALRRLGLSNDNTIVVYSTTHLMWATRLWWVLRSCGLDDVRVLDGGLAAWMAAGHATHEGEEPTPAPGTVTIDFDARRWADVAEVEANLGSGSACTINALTADIHAGTGPVSYGRPGHIRGSVNVPFDHLSKGSSLLDWSEIRSRFEEQGAFSASRVVTYCGGGIAATLAAFALQQLGHPDVAVYDGSLSEWASDPDRPMELGS